MTEISQPARPERVSWSSFLGQEVIAETTRIGSEDARFEVAELALSSGAWLRANTEVSTRLCGHATGGDILQFGQFDGVGWWEWQAAVLESGHLGRLRVGSPEGLSRRDRRVHRRVQVEVPVSFAKVTERGTANLDLETINISEGGMAVASPRTTTAIDFSEGSDHLVLVRVEDKPLITVVATVKGHRNDGVIRFEFTQLVSVERAKLQDFIAHAIAREATQWSDNVERRSYRRFVVDTGVVLLIATKEGFRSLQGRTKDLSEGGAAVSAEGELPESDTVVGVQLQLHSTEVIVAARVVSLAGGLVRLAFSNPPARASQLREFLSAGQYAPTAEWSRTKSPSSSESTDGTQPAL